MKRSLLAWLRCPICLATLEPDSAKQEIIEGRLTCANAHRFPVRRGVPRFVQSDAYTQSFSYEWQRFRRTQLDSATGRTDTRDRLQASLNFPIQQLNGMLVLDAGCGMGRFAEVVHACGGTYIGMDFSYAIDAAFQNAGHLPNVHFVQADLFHTPFGDNMFDLVMSLGVLHHTPDPRRAFASLPRVLKPGGKLTVTVYDAGNKVYVANSRFWRRYTTRLPSRLLHVLSYAAAPLYYLWTLPIVGGLLRSVAFLSLERDWRWRVLDTFDWYSPQYMSWHTHPEVFSWFKENHFEQIDLLAPSISQIGTKPSGVQI
ncbi:MAG: methyltransferase domain-containing protein [Chloroflexi bacterium]|nr:methyltransferase domain-containing protein [Chloroflexota bacterium]